MDQPPEEHKATLRQQNSVLSDLSIGSNSTFVNSPQSPIVSYRPGYRRLASTADDPPSAPILPPIHQDAQGLGIAGLEDRKGEPITRKPLQHEEKMNAPGSAEPLLSPTSAKITGMSHHDFGDQYGIDLEEAAHERSDSSPYQPFSADSEHEALHKKHKSSGTLQSIVPSYQREFACSTKKPLATGRGNWLAVCILILSVYSTIFSGIWLFIAITKPRYDHTITSDHGKLSISTASLLCAAFAKSIELSFVTVFVAFLGQLLSSRALARRKGVTVAEMSMRSWIMQPGTMLTHWESVRYAAGTILGMIALTAALMAMVYTTASDALVAPKLKFGKVENRLVYGKVAAEFANSAYMMDQCNSPIQTKNDPQDEGSTCITIQHSGQSYHNYMQYLSNWVDHIGAGNGSTNMKHRPAPVAMLNDNTTVTGSWLQTQENNMTELSQIHGRIVNNVTMAMPHSGVYAAAREPLNGIIQPEGQDGLGEYYLQASVPSPVVNVLCANLTDEELTPMIYTQWPKEYFNGTLPDTANWPNDFNLSLPDSLRFTAVDKLFEFDNETNIHPIFPKLPVPYNTVLNFSKSWGWNSIYLLATTENNATTMCSLRAALTPDCSTEYHSSLSGGSISTTCEDPNNRLAYSRSEPNATNGIWQGDWVDVAGTWASSISLNDGISDSDASNARLLTQLIPTTHHLDPSLPSLSEALAVLAGGSLLLSTLDTPFIHFWNYSTEVFVLTEPQYQAFNATLRAQIYASGGTQSWQRIFYVVLALVFITNIICLIYFGISGSLVTDFIEPQNLFCLSLNSPPSNVLEGSCGGGPEREHFSSKWHILLDREKNHFYFEGTRAEAGSGRKRDKRTDFEMGEGAVARMYSRIGKKRTSFL